MKFDEAAGIGTADDRYIEKMWPPRMNFKRMNVCPLTPAESHSATRKPRALRQPLSIAGFLLAIACGGCGSTAAPTATTPPSSTPAGPPKPLDGATITITATGFKLDATSAAAFT